MNQLSVMNALRNVTVPNSGNNIVDSGFVDEIRFGDECIEVQIGTTITHPEEGDRIVKVTTQVLENEFSELKSIDVTLACNPEWKIQQLQAKHFHQPAPS